MIHSYITCHRFQRCDLVVTVCTADSLCQQIKIQRKLVFIWTADTNSNEQLNSSYKQYWTAHTNKYWTANTNSTEQPNSSYQQVLNSSYQQVLNSQTAHTKQYWTDRNRYWTVEQPNSSYQQVLNSQTAHTNSTEQLNSSYQQYWTAHTNSTELYVFC
jgi:hypothetical protein